MDHGRREERRLEEELKESEAERSLGVSHLKGRNVFFCLLIIFPLGPQFPFRAVPRFLGGILIDCAMAGICTAPSHSQQVWPFSATLARAEREGELLK